MVSCSTGIVSAEFGTSLKARWRTNGYGKEDSDNHQAKIQTTIKLQLPAGKATPAPPVGTALGPHGLNIMDFCKQFNAKTAKEPDGMIFPVLVTVYTDRTFTFILKTPPASVLLKRAANIAKGSAEPNRNKVGKVTKKQVVEIAKIKLVDLNTSNLESAVRTVMGTARNMGLEVVEA